MNRMFETRVYARTVIIAHSVRYCRFRPAVRRCLQRFALDRLDELIGAWVWLRTATIGGRRVIAFNSKTLRGAKDAADNLVHLLAELCQRTGTVFAQLAVGTTTNEVPCGPHSLDSIADITELCDHQ